MSGRYAPIFKSFTAGYYRSGKCSAYKHTVIITIAGYSNTKPFYARTSDIVGVRCITTFRNCYQSKEAAARIEMSFDRPPQVNHLSFIITTSRMTTGDELKSRNALAGCLERGMGDNWPERQNLQSGAFALTVPNELLAEIGTAKSKQ